MNFKPTLWKSIVSFLTIIFVIIIDFLLIGSVQIECIPYPDASCPNVFNIKTIIISIIFGLIVYVIWSLIQKGKKRR